MPHKMKWSNIKFAHMAADQTCSRRTRSLVENEPWKPVKNGIRHRFSNRFPPTETNGLALGHRLFNPVPQAPIGTGWKVQPVLKGLPPTGTKEAAMLTQGGSPFGTGWSFQPVPMIFFSFFPKSSFVCYIYYCLFFYNY